MANLKQSLLICEYDVQVYTRTQLPLARLPGRIAGDRLLRSRMLQLLRDLVDHKGYANAAMLQAVRQNPAAASDPEMLDLLHHILLANRFWLLSVSSSRSCSRTSLTVHRPLTHSWSDLRGPNPGKPPG
jgi:hypothetical protein